MNIACLRWATCVWLIVGLIACGSEADGSNIGTSPQGGCFNVCPSRSLRSPPSGVCCRPMSCSFVPVTCCGETFASLDCSCSRGGGFECLENDECIGGDASCPEPCTEEECGGPFGPSYYCDDFQVGGETCERNAFGDCVLESRDCTPFACAELGFCPTDYSCQEVRLDCDDEPCPMQEVCVPDPIR